jgi:hypothetical protein
MALAWSMILLILEFAARLFQLARQSREGVEARDRHVEDRLDALLLEPVDHIGGHAGLDGLLDGIAASERSTNMAIGFRMARGSG